MGNLVSSLISGVLRVVGNILGAPVDFLTGRSCSSVCGSTWDLICYIENFCVANLLKLVAVLVLLYIVLLFVYLLYKVGICQCVCKNMCKMLWACLTSYVSACEYGVTFLWFKMKNLKRERQEKLRDMEEDYGSYTYDEVEEGMSYSHRPREVKYRRTLSVRSRDRRRDHLERSLRTRSHRTRIGIARRPVHEHANGRDRRSHGHHVSTVHNIKVTHTSKFVQKANGRRIHRSRRR